MERKVLLSVFLLILPYGSFGVGLHEISKRESGKEWGYDKDDGPHTWGDHCKDNNNRQSPININTDDVKLNPALDEFDFDNFEKNFENAKIENNGHTIKVVPAKDEAPRTFKQGGLHAEYQFLQLHFHWGSRSTKGSEHLINNRTYPLEMHMVFMNKKYKDVESAKKESDGLAVLGVLFKLDEEDNKDLDPIINEIPDVKDEKDSDKLGPFNLKSLLPDNTMPYYRYDGSLTTPPCLEIVTWTVFKEFSEISERQLEKFRGTQEDDSQGTEKLVDNFRPPQPLGDRKVEISGMSHSASSSLIPSILTAMFTAISLIL